MNRIEFEGCLARKLRFQIFNSWNSKDASHESFALTWIMDAIWMLGFARNIVCFPGKRSFRYDGLRRRRFAVECSRTEGAVELMVSGCFFSSLMMPFYCVSNVLRHFVHWNCCIEEMRSLLDLLEFEGCLARKLVFVHSTVGIWRRPRTKAFRFQIFNCWNLKDASHESFAFISWNLEFEGCLARKLRFHESWMRFEC